MSDILSEFDEIAAALGALATSMQGERREGVLLAAQACGLVVK